MKKFLKSVVVRILTFEAKRLLNRRRPVIVAVTGSVGKTAAKDAIYSILKNHYVTRKSEKSFNSEIGVPLTVLGLPNAWNNPFLWLKNIVDGFFIAFFAKDYPEYLIIEAGIDRPNDMVNLTKWLKPHIVVLTRLPDVPVHVEYFASPEAVVEEKLRLVDALDPEGVIVYNHDDEIIQSKLPEFRHKAIGFSRYLSSHFLAGKDQIYYRDDVPAGISFVIDNLGDKYEVKVAGAVGVQYVYTCAAAIATAVSCGVSVAEAAKALEEYLPPPGRMNILAGIKGTVIIDDSYNASPAATVQALATLKEIRYAKRKIAVLGDMLELGQFSAREHEKIGEFVPHCADVLFTVGVRARSMAEASLNNGLSDKTVYQYDDAARAGRELQAFIKPGDVILIKGSQGVRAERIVEEIMQEPERASELLVRQGREWQKRK
ncbi:MAG: UDP-N-acetylmuramoyl-tripeptide--D-alanyl-D-alanine ligase [Candidatus Nomurabacteria bacterium]|nr:UDP-N-acetylmuramoyl-tripeptide--D-alanyl-D-alanine ligase [Candidatus Nomurabacteria bacterium]USN87962.1 MAG: UDP-N-acetylmuramoyl-tripeptide--D-alanyl-D-alanine ligase [Candidatus Nomurabacteria bacterium]